jgi:hypothetical protein
MREMSTPEGGFASSLDADAQGEEGRYYLWTPAEIDSVLGTERSERFCQMYNVSDTGNFENNQSILNLPESAAIWAERLSISLQQLHTELARDSAKLLETRSQRVPPGRDDKVLTDWNGLMISALVRGFAVLGNERYLTAAQKCADRLLSPFEKDRALVHSFLGARTLKVQLLMDYGALGNGLLDLFLADGDVRWFRGSEALARQLDSQFGNPSDLYVMSTDTISGAAATDPFDSAMPSGVSLAGNLLARLYDLTGNEWYEQRARRQVEPVAGLMRRSAQAFSQSMVTVDMLAYPPAELVLVGDKARDLWRVAQDEYVPGIQVVWLPHVIDLQADSSLELLLEGKDVINGKPTAFLCRNFVCELPTTEADGLRKTLQRLAAQVPEDTTR